MKINKMASPCTYTYAFDVMTLAAAHCSTPMKYPPWVVRDIALKCVGAIDEDDFLERMAAAVENSAFKTNPYWDGSIA